MKHLDSLFTREDDAENTEDVADKKSRLKEIETYLTENPADQHALLQQAELQLDLRQNLAGVGHFLTEYAEAFAEEPRFQRLRDHAHATATEQLSQARQILRRTNLSRLSPETLGILEDACKLARWDPSIKLGAALAILNEMLPLEILLDTSPIPLTSGLHIASFFEGVVDYPFLTRMAKQFLTNALPHIPPGSTSHDACLQYLMMVFVIENVIGTDDATFPFSGDVSTSAISGAAKLLLIYGIRKAAVLTNLHQYESASQILHALIDAFPSLPAPRLLLGEMLRIQEHSAAAREVFTGALERCDAESTTLDQLAPEQFEQMMRNILSFHQTCPRCGHAFKPIRTICPVCNHKPTVDTLLFEDGAQGDYKKISDKEIALASLARLSIDAKLPLDAVRYLQQSDTNHEDHFDLHQEVHEMAAEAGVSTTGLWDALSEFDQFIHPESEQISISKNPIYSDSNFWKLVEVEDQRAALRRLIAHEPFSPVTQQLCHHLLSAQPDQPELLELRQKLVAAQHEYTKRCYQEAREAFEHALYDEALNKLNEALDIHSDHADMLFFRAQLHEALNDKRAALRDYLAVIATDDSDEQQSALKNAARIYEKLGNHQAALQLLNQLEATPSVVATKNRLQLLLDNRPAVEVQPVESLIMNDTLQPATEPRTAWHAYLAIELQAAARNRDADSNEYVSQLIQESLDFVSLLGNLYHIEGDPVLSLRYISRPTTRNQQGKVRIAFILRMTGDTPDEASELVVSLWRRLHKHLPYLGSQVAQYGVVYDRQYLRHLLSPFEAQEVSMAEIVRRELPASDSLPYNVLPFAPGSTTLQNLLKVLIEHESDAAVSVNIVPTTLTNAEQTQLTKHLDQAATQEGSNTGLNIGENDDDYTTLFTPGSSFSEFYDRNHKVQNLHTLINSLQPVAFVTKIQVAWLGDSALLPERIASILFSNRRTASSAVQHGYEVVYPSTDTEADILRCNFDRVDVQQSAYSLAPAGLQRIRYLTSVLETAIAFRLPVPERGGLPSIAGIDARPIQPPANMPDNGVLLGLSVYRQLGSPIPIRQAPIDRRRHTYVVGKTGTGKTTLIKRLAQQDIDRGHGICIIDPHGDLIEELLYTIPPERANDVVLFDAADYERPVGLNLLSHNNELHRHLIANEFIGLLVRMYDPHNQGIVGPRFQHNVRQALLTAMEFDGFTLVEVVRILTNQRYLKTLLPRIKDPMVRSYWVDQVANTSDYHRSEILDYIVSKFSRFVSDRRIRNIIGQRHSTIDFRHIMDNRQILLVNLSKGKIGPENAQFLGLLLLQNLLITALGRATLHPAQRAEFFLYLDEFQNFATDLFSVMLSEGRKYGVAATVANQFFRQIPEQVRSAIFGNVGTIACFNMGIEDASAIAPEFYPSISTQDLINLPRFTASVRLMVNDTRSHAFNMTTLPDDSVPDERIAAQIRDASRQKYGRDIHAVTQDILERMKQD